MIMAGNERGVSTLKIWLWLLFLGTVIYTGIKLVPPYIDSERMKDEMQIKASLAQVLKDDEIRTALVAKAKELEIPLGPESFLIERDEGNHRMKISTAWDVEVHFPYDVYVKYYHFAPVADEDTQRARQ
jgi:hypothetical protein